MPNRNPPKPPGRKPKPELTAEDFIALPRKPRRKLSYEEERKRRRAEQKKLASEQLAAIAKRQAEQEAEERAKRNAAYEKKRLADEKIMQDTREAYSRILAENPNYFKRSRCRVIRDGISDWFYENMVALLIIFLLIVFLGSAATFGGWVLGLTDPPTWFPAD